MDIRRAGFIVEKRAKEHERLDLIYVKLVAYSEDEILVDIFDLEGDAVVECDLS
jgi:hypothetical protein